MNHPGQEISKSDEFGAAVRVIRVRAIRLVQWRKLKGRFQIGNKMGARDWLESDGPSWERFGRVPAVACASE